VQTSSFSVGFGAGGFEVQHVQQSPVHLEYFEQAVSALLLFSPILHTQFPTQGIQGSSAHVFKHLSGRFEGFGTGVSEVHGSAAKAVVKTARKKADGFILTFTGRVQRQCSDVGGV
jgi:hypothetical protein